MLEANTMSIENAVQIIEQVNEYLKELEKDPSMRVVMEAEIRNTGLLGIDGGEGWKKYADLGGRSIRIYIEIPNHKKIRVENLKDLI